MKSADYWKKRMESIENMSHSKGVAYANNVEQQFRQAESAINAKIERWYQRLADNNEISLSAAKNLLNDDELEDFHMDVQEYIQKGKTLKYDDKWAKQLENASAKVHISRLEALKLQMQQQCEELYGNMTDGLDAHLRDVYTNGYYHTAYEIQRGLNVGWGFNRLDERKIEKAINSCWTNDSKTFKARCWTNKTKLVNELNTVLTQNIIRGEEPQKAINALAHRMKVSKYNAGRLIMTESAAISSMSQHDCFKELDVEEFEFVATLDSHTSEICRAMDGKHFKMSDYTIGLNAPPLHCFCRSCTVPYFADDVGERIARREDGSTYYVSSDTTYEKWKKTVDVTDKKDVNVDVLEEVPAKFEPITFGTTLDDSKFDVWLNNYTKNLKMTEREQDALKIYTGMKNSHEITTGDIQNYLRLKDDEKAFKKAFKKKKYTSEFMDELERTCNEISSAISKNITTEDYVTFRGMSDMTWMNVDFDNAVGQTFVSKGFTSTSFNVLKAERFIKSGDVVGSLEIEVPRGSRAICVDKFSEYKGEAELLFDNNSCFEIIECTKRELKKSIGTGTYTRVDMKVRLLNAE